MPILQDILKHVPVVQITGNTNMDIKQITFDSRKVVPHTLFVAQKGTLTDGHLYINKAIEMGASAIICEQLPVELPSGITFIHTSDSNRALSFLAANFYGNPSQHLKLIGITGTNGKTTLATLSHALFQKAGFHAGLISTVVIKIGNTDYPTSHTTPDALTLNRFLSEMVADGVSHCFMEVSSHGIHQKRTESLHFAGGVFTNLTHDHLDYHKTFAEYRDVKKSFFDTLPAAAFALSNIDDKNGSVMLQNTLATKKTYALKTLADYKAKVLENRLEGLILQINGHEVYTKLIGNFNAYNILAIYGIASELGLESLEILRIISDLESVSGRFQFFISNEGITAIVDYAHTPDALVNVLQTLNEIRTGNENLITIVGCGGDRDKTKRPKMAHIASQLSTTAIFTSDNPRSEDPKVIIDEMEAGVSPENYRKTLSILDRKEAIKAAGKMVRKGDIVLIAGKGHETYQEIKGVKYDFDDFKIAKEIFN
ncbi:MAG: UDP-N-acetylmuramoyl-L-alanyl-D-glutamate--2,6-diaminopimelate ligase [Flavobacteriaceae bacterium]|nr:UDP-N-acetylmuramoyl-L-alanyl-D-glutamate--2,6-diaminopimelate ligase [Flavobacteriaceae bacterium]